MPDPDRILTLHPEGKQGVNIERAKYDDMRRALLRLIPATSLGIPLKDVRALVPGELDPEVYRPKDSAVWYLIAVKQDLEARGEIEIVPRARPQALRRVTTGK